MDNLNALRLLIASARTAEALKQLSVWAQTQSPIWQQATSLLKASWANNEQQSTQGLISYEEAERVRNRVTAGILGLLAEIESGASAPKVVLEGLQKQFLNDQVSAIIQGGNVANLSGSNISVQGSNDVFIGSGNTITKKTGLGRRQFMSLSVGFLVLFIVGYFAFDLLSDQQNATYASLQEIQKELKLRGGFAETQQTRLEGWLNAGINALQRKDYPQSVDNFEKVVAEAPLATVHQNLAYAYEKMGQADKAKENLAAAKKIIEQPAMGAINLTGAWESAEWEWGPMLILQTGNQISGTYTHDNGQLSGTIQNSRIAYKWWELVEKGQAYERAEKRERGDGYFIVAPDGKSISGKWRYEGDVEWQGEMSAVRK